MIPWIARMRRRVPYMPQMESVECGAACLGMVLAWHGHHAPLADLRLACDVGRDGVNALAILRAARRYGLQAEAFKVEDPADLKDLPLPAILHWEFNHFVVLEHLSERGAWIVDPAGGRRRLPPEAFAKSFTGVVLAFEPEPGFKARAHQRPSLAPYRGVIQSHLPSLGHLLLTSGLIQIAGLVAPVAQQLLVDRVILPKQEPWLWGLALGMILAVGIQAVFNMARSWVIDNLQVALDLGLMRRFMAHLLSLPVGFFLLRKPGDLLQRLDSNSQLRSMFSSRLVSTVLDGLLLVGYGGLMLAYNLRLGLVVVALGTARLLLQMTVRNYTRQLLSTELALAGDSSGTLLEMLSSVETIRAVGAENAAIRRWTERMINRSNASLRRQRLEMLSGQVSAVVNALGTTLVYAMAGQEVLQGRMTIGVFSAFLSLQGMFLTPFMSLVGSLGTWQHLTSHLARLDDVMEAQPEPQGGVVTPPLQGGIELEDVAYAYSPGSPLALRNITVSIPPGAKVALVGPSGAGKTTLARLILGMLLPTEGRVRFDGHDLQTLELASLRRQFGVVLQETFLFNDTVKANLAFNDPDVPLAQLESAARLACIHDVIEGLPQGYDTPLGENASILSGGQRQRLSLARALAHAPAILLLDEATSSLDLSTESRVHANLATLGCTRIVIAHRLATVKDADLILVLEDGRVIQSGTYESLRAQEGMFSSLVDAAGEACA